MVVSDMTVFLSDHIFDNPYQEVVYFKIILLSILKYSSSIFLSILYVVSIQILVY